MYCALSLPATASGPIYRWPVATVRSVPSLSQKLLDKRPGSSSPHELGNGWAPRWCSRATSERRACQSPEAARSCYQESSLWAASLVTTHDYIELHGGCLRARSTRSCIPVMLPLRPGTPGHAGAVFPLKWSRPGHSMRNICKRKRRLGPARPWDTCFPMTMRYGYTGNRAQQRRHLGWGSFARAAQVPA